MNNKKRTPVAYLIPQETVESKIFFLRNEKIMLDSDLAMLYNVETKQLKRAVNRNLERFPDDFMFKLTKEEYKVLRCQFGTLKRGRHTKYLPYAFSEQGIAMLSSVLNSKRAILVKEIGTCLVPISGLSQFLTLACPLACHAWSYTERRLYHA